jgi:hypothetical protein
MLQALRDDVVALAALDVDDEAQTAGIALVDGVVEALGLGRPGRSAGMRDFVHANLASA